MNDDPTGARTSNPSLYDVLIEAESYFRQQAKTFAGYRDEAHWQSMATAAAAQAARALSERSQSPSETKAPPADKPQPSPVSLTLLLRRGNTMVENASNPATIVEQLRKVVADINECGNAHFNADAEEVQVLSKAAGELERLTRERDHWKAEAVKWEGNERNRQGERDRLRAALERIANREADAREIMDQNRWPSTLAVDLAGMARLALSGEPSPVETKAPPADKPPFELVIKVCEGRGSFQDGCRVRDYVRYLEGELYRPSEKASGDPT